MTPRSNAPTTEQRPTRGRPRILYLVYNLSSGGSERQFVNLLRAAGSRLHAHCHVLNRGGFWDAEVQRLAAEFTVSRFRSPVLRAMELLRLIRAVKPDAVHSWHSYLCVYPLLSKALHRRPVIANLRGDATIDQETGHASFPQYFRLMRFADVVVSNSAPALRTLGARGLRFRASAVIPNGVEVGPAPNTERPQFPVRIVGVGRLNALKNWAQIIRVVGRLLQAGAPVTLTIFGEGPERPELEALCRQWGLEPATVLPGQHPDAAGELSRFDILVHCALSEGAPNAVLEGLAAGLPGVASDLEVCREWAAHGDFLQLFPAGEDDELERHLGCLIRHPEERHRRGRRAREFILQEFSCAAMADAYLRLYHELGKGRAGLSR